jgi:hypothetical protein
VCSFISCQHRSLHLCLSTVPGVLPTHICLRAVCVVDLTLLIILWTTYYATQARLTLQHQQLVAEVLSQLSFFRPDPKVLYVEYKRQFAIVAGPGTVLLLLQAERFSWTSCLTARF